VAKRRLNGDGSIYQRADGLWVGRVSIDGKLRQVSARTQTLASQKLQKLKQSPFDASTQTLGEFLADWLEEVCRPTLKPRTYASYADLVRLHIAPDLGHVKLAKLSAQHVQTWRNKKLASGRAPRTVLHMYAVLRTALNRAVKYELVQRNVALLVDPPTVKPADIHPLTPDRQRGRWSCSRPRRLPSPRAR
jgi:integrase